MSATSQVSDLRQTSEACIITLYPIKKGRRVKKAGEGEEARTRVVWVWRTDGKGKRKIEIKRERHGR